MSFSKHLFNFKAPVVYHLEHLDFVIEEKMLLLLSWKFKEEYLLSIPTLKKRYRQQELAVILKIPPNVGVININVTSIWRRRKYKLVLKRFKLDEGTSQLIIKQFKPLKTPNLTMAEIAIRASPLTLSSPIPFLKKSNISLRSINIEPRNEKFIYPS